MLKLKLLITPLLLLALAVPVEAQTLRERLRERVEARRAERAAREEGAGAQAGAAGIQTVTIVHDGQERSFVVYVPANLEGPPGAVLEFHGGGGNAERTAGRRHLIPAADRGGFLVVYPNSSGRGVRWNDGRVSTAGGADDVGFVRAVVAQLEADYGLDRSRVFATGLSNGGFFTYRLACDAPDLVAGIAPVAANMPSRLAERCSPGQGTPVMMFLGTEDPLVPFEGGVPEPTRLSARMSGEGSDPVLSGADSARFWAGINGCGGSDTQDLPDAADDGTTVTQIGFGGCRAGAVVLYRINGGGHTWPGGEGALRPAGPTSREIDAAATMVRFFEQHGL